MVTDVRYVEKAGSRNFSRSEESWIRPYEQRESMTVSGIGLTRVSSKALSRGTASC